MLNKKQNIKDNAEWLNAFEHCTDKISVAEIRDLEHKTLKLINSVGNAYGNICSGWIAGKDSLALDRILSKAGIDYTPVMWQGVNQYPAMIEWIANNKPENLITETVDKFTLEFLEAHPDYLFCQNGTRTKWMSEKWKRYKADIKKHGFDLFIVARRLKDGNICGSRENGYIVKKDYNTFSPLAEWSHEQVLAYIKYENIPLPPFYFWKRGFLIGSVAMGEWTERPVLDLSVDDVWREIYEIDKSIVFNAADTLTSAKTFLERNNLSHEN